MEMDGCEIGEKIICEQKNAYFCGVSRLGVRELSGASAGGTVPKIEYRYRATNQYSK